LLSTVQANAFRSLQKTVTSIYLCRFLLWSGLEILAFPCNQFGGQEPGTNEQIAEFACTRFKAEYPIFGKVVYPTKHLSFLC
jgi:glutathione peroxidase-family protein